MNECPALDVILQMMWAKRFKYSKSVVVAILDFQSRLVGNSSSPLLEAWVQCLNAASVAWQDEDYEPAAVLGTFTPNSGIQHAIALMQNVVASDPILQEELVRVRALQPFTEMLDRAGVPDFTAILKLTPSSTPQSKPSLTHDYWFDEHGTKGDWL